MKIGSNYSVMMVMTQTCDNDTYVSSFSPHLTEHSQPTPTDLSQSVSVVSD